MKQDLRQWIRETQQAGELRTFHGVHWRVEMGAVAELAARSSDTSALLFDEVPGYPPGFRVLINSLSSPSRLARMAGIPASSSSLGVVEAWKNRYSHLEPIPYLTVEEGPLQENKLLEEQVDLLRFPAPYWRSGDGGRYLGTGTLCVTRDPDTGTANVSTSRVMIHDPQHCFYRVSLGKDSRRHFDLAQRRTKRLPIAISCGHHPSLLLVSSLNLPYGTCEYDTWGGLSGEAMRCLSTPLHDLPVPAYSELVLEGEVLTDQTALEGPFGEWSGYYSREAREEPLIRVQGIYHRDDPVLLGVATSRPPSELTTFWAVLRSALLWSQLQEAGIGSIHGVWCHPAGGTRLFTVVSLRQTHPGHARQALMAAAALPAGAYMGRYLVAVDEDIDPTDIDSVLWAMGTRSDPARDVDLIRGAWGGPLDPAVGSEGRGTNSRLLIDACRPVGRRSNFPAVAGYSEEEKKRAMECWTRNVRREP